MRKEIIGYLAFAALMLVPVMAVTANLTTKASLVAGIDNSNLYTHAADQPLDEDPAF